MQKIYVPVMLINKSSHLIREHYVRILPNGKYLIPKGWKLDPREIQASDFYDVTATGKARRSSVNG